MSSRLALFAMLVWSAAATAQTARYERIIELDGDAIRACGVRVTASDREGYRVDARLDQARVDGAVQTGLSLTLFDPSEDSPVPLANGRIVTRTVDTAKLMAKASDGASYVGYASLEDSPDGGFLFRELLVGGGEVVVVPARGEARRFAVPGPAPRDVTAGYLHCTGDLVGPAAAASRDG